LESALIAIINDENGRTLVMEPSNDFEVKNAILVKAIISYLKDKVDESVTIEEICEQFHVCKTTLSVNFKEGTSKSILDYYNHLKIIRSMELLTDKSLNIGEVAMRLNYSSSQYFSKMFKKYTGVSPRQFQKKYSEDVDGIKETYFRR
jgi:two-component system response regulator YesN